MSTQITSSKVVRDKYNWYSRFYDYMETLSERAFGVYRQRILPQLRGRILEIGVGTGLNIPYYCPQIQPVAVELSEGMLNKAQHRAIELGKEVFFVQADVERLPFKSNQFDVAVATLVFSSVAHPVLGLRELARVIKKTGQVILLEHVLTEQPVLKEIMKKMNFIPAMLLGFVIDRQTAKNIQKAGLQIEEEQNLIGDVLKLFRARPSAFFPIDPFSTENNQ
ncbi:MAG: class I SAM-dependent methyltransferase [Candidatus Heimdallarchaeota archaeon]